MKFVVHDELGITEGGYERTPLSGRQYRHLQMLFAFGVEMKLAAQALEKRAEQAGCSEELKQLVELSETLFRQIMRTVPDNKVAQVMKNLSMTRFYVRCEAPGQQQPNPNYVYVPAESLDIVLNEVIENRCMMCDKTEIEGRKCGIRQAMEDCLPHAVKVARGSDKCKYADLGIGLDAVVEV
jgi:hypothetical protein